MEEYIDQVGSLDADKLDKKSFKDIKNFVQGEIESHEQVLADETEPDGVRNHIFDSNLPYFG